MCYSQVTITVTNKGERNEFWFVFETPHLTFADQMAALAADGGLLGIRHDTAPVRGEDGRSRARQIVESYQLYISKTSIVTVTELRGSLLSASGEVLA